MKRVFLVVLDSCGIGAMPDAAAFGDKNCHTLKRIAASPRFSAETLCRMGLGNIEGVDCLSAVPQPIAAVARMTEKSSGKDTTVGHWEIAGVVSNRPMPTYPNGFPPEVMDAFCRATGRGVLCNRPYSGTQVIADYGDEHLRTGHLIVYTSADSVFQIAAHEALVPPEQLYEYCRMARKLLVGEHGVGRVIARPFIGKAPKFTRTANRRDFSLEPPKSTVLDAICESGQTVVAVGKIRDIFAGRGISEWIPTHGNLEGMKAAETVLSKDFTGLCFVNLVDFDMLYGHRQDVDGYAAAFSAFDRWLPGFTAAMKAEDVLMITADHGCDPGDSSTDHTREFTPLLAFGRNVKPGNYGTRESFADIAATVAAYLKVDYAGDGRAIDLWRDVE